MHGPRFTTLASSAAALRLTTHAAGQGRSQPRVRLSLPTANRDLGTVSTGPTAGQCPSGHTSGLHIPAFVRELVIVVAAVMAYFLVRGLTEGSQPEAVANAQRLVDLESALHVGWEPRIQAFLDGRPWLETLGNWVYIWGHWPFIAVIAVWLFRRHRARYYLVRNAFLISGAIGLVVFVLFPVAPPRLAGLGLEDTVTQHSQAYRVLQPPAMVNQYAAVPSLHFGWNLLAGGSVVFLCRIRVLRVLAAWMTVAMLIAVIITANHFVLDVVAGAAVALVGLAASYNLRQISLFRNGAEESSERFRGT
jgi:PAP2 superfamily